MESMKEESGVLVIACRTMAGVSSVASNSVAQQPFPTPSPFSFSAASTGRSSRPFIYVSSLVLRLLALLFSFASALSLATPSSKKKGHTPSSFTEYPELIYCFIVATLAFAYSAFQLFRGISDIAPRGNLISNKTYDYISFTFDQLAGYLLISSSTIAIPVIKQIEQIEQHKSLWKAAIIFTSMSFATFVVIAICALLSGYKLCKRIIW